MACKTSDKAVFRGDASAKLAGSIGVDLGTCEFLDVTISLSEFGGKFGQAIAAFSDQIETTHPTLPTDFTESVWRGVS